MSLETLRSVWDILAGDINKSGRNAFAALKLLDAMAASLGSTMSWQSAARAMGFESPARVIPYDSAFSGASCFRVPY